MPMQQGSSTSQPYPSVLLHLWLSETPDMVLSSGCPHKALGTSRGAVARCRLHNTYQTENLAWPGTQKKKVQTWYEDICRYWSSWPWSWLKAQRCERTKTSVSVISWSSQSIWIKFGVQLMLVVLMTFILFSSGLISSQGRETYLLTYIWFHPKNPPKTKKLQRWLAFGHLLISFKHVAVIKMTELQIQLPVWLTMTFFIECHNCMRN